MLICYVYNKTFPLTNLWINLAQRFLPCNQQRWKSVSPFLLKRNPSSCIIVSELRQIASCSLCWIKINRYLHELKYSLLNQTTPTLHFVIPPLLAYFSPWIHKQLLKIFSLPLQLTVNTLSYVMTVLSFAKFSMHVYLHR